MPTARRFRVVDGACEVEAVVEAVVEVVVVEEGMTILNITLL